MKSLSREEVRGVDLLAIRQFGVPGVVLMENAGRNAANAIERFLGELAGRRVAIVAGAGNNGGDGFVVARHMSMRGANVVTFLVAPLAKVTGDALVNLQIIAKLGLAIRMVGDETPGALAMQGLGVELAKFDCIVDAVGGTGISGPLRGDIASAVEQINEASHAAQPGSASPRVIAIDIPTGMDCDTGDAPTPTVEADMTVTFVARKNGFDVPGANEHTGQVIVADIGIPADMILAKMQIPG